MSIFAEIDAQINELIKQKEALAIQHNQMFTDGSEYNTNYFFPNRESFMKYFGYRNDEEMEWIDKEHTFPGWISSGEMY